MMDIKVEGTITIDGQTAEFCCELGEPWYQWGGPTDVLCMTQPITEAIDKALLEL